MSHFCVLVVTAEPPTDEVLTAALQPFHEFECTGCDDQYVQQIDQLSEAREQYQAAQVVRFKAPDGTLFCRHEDQFYRDPTEEEVKKIGRMYGGMGWAGGVSYYSKDWGDGRGYRPKIHFKPDGYEEVELPAKDLMSFEEWVGNNYSRNTLIGGQPDLEGSHKYGWVRLDETHTDAPAKILELVKRTNPNHKWDWWVVGGRYSGRFYVKGQAEACDWARKGDIDWERWLAERRAARLAAVEQALQKASDKAGVTRQQLLDAQREAAGRYPALRAELDALQAAGGGDGIALVDILKSKHEAALDLVLAAGLWNIDGLCGPFGVDMPKGEADPLAWASQVPAFSAFAMLRDGVWAERGEMGWWACASEEKADWPEQFAALLAAVPDDHYLTAVDCHT